MTTPLHCPFCSSEKVYVLLNTFHCKRCKNIWKEDRHDANRIESRSSAPVNNQAWMIKKKTENLETRMGKQLDEYLKRSNGTFSMDKISWKIGDISLAMFRRYLKICVKNKILVEKKDKYGIVWYSRPD